MKSLTQLWWLSAIKALLLLIFGVVCLVKPLDTAEALAAFLALLLLIDGTFSLIAAFTNWKNKEDRWMLLADSLLGLGLGLLLFLYPEVTLMLVVISIAAWFVLAGLFRMMQAIAIRKEIEGEGWLVLGGILQMLFGTILVFYPDVVIGTLTVIFGFFAGISGLILLIISLRYRKLFND